MSGRRPRYTAKFREEYGRSLTSKEIRLIQAYRGMVAIDPDGAGRLLNSASELFIFAVKWRREDAAAARKAKR